MMAHHASCCSVDGSNSFAWNADADEGANAWDLGEDYKPDASIEYDDADVEALVKDDGDEGANDDAAVEAAESSSDDTAAESESESIESVAQD